MDEPSFDWAKAHGYLGGLHAPLSDVLAGIEPPSGVQVQPTVGPQAAALLDVLIRAAEPPRILEIGTSCGYAACVMGMAAAAYGGTVVTMEIRGDLADAARRNVARLGLEATVSVLEGDARELVMTLTGSFGLILQDGHKELYEPLLDPLLERLDKGGLLVSDDVLFPVMKIPERVRGWAEAIERYNRRLRGHPLLRTTWLPIGDGVAVSVKHA
ncbi:MAG: class I SAM-dependent methyltransferase [bacterium]|nr:class I SAM-dependent methyltransferase [bacterium]